LGYVLSKGKDIEGVGSEDLVNYIDVGATYYFNKNMSAFVDYKRRNDVNPEITDRFEFFIGGREIGNGFSELNDAEDQAQRFLDQ
ncbi:porin, partial [Salmonella enterica subsp. enterica serovar Montevideo]|nr:porin [Salmonella enterica subsp. enterica serovar Montevideo]